MKFLLVLALALSNSALASGLCTDSVRAQAVDLLPRAQVVSVERKFSLNPGQDEPLLQGEVWNDTDHVQDVYLVKTSFMAEIDYGFMVNPNNCKVENTTEVYIED